MKAVIHVIVSHIIAVDDAINCGNAVFCSVGMHLVERLTTGNIILVTYVACGSSSTTIRVVVIVVLHVIITIITCNGRSLVYVFVLLGVNGISSSAHILINSEGFPDILLQLIFTANYEFILLHVL